MVHLVGMWVSQNIKIKYIYIKITKHYIALYHSLNSVMGRSVGGQKGGVSPSDSIIIRALTSGRISVRPRCLRNSVTITVEKLHEKYNTTRKTESKNKDGYS